MSRAPQLLNQVLFYEGGLKIDGDGSPRCYGPHNSGLDLTANAGGVGDWYGVLTDKDGDPVIQSPNDPYPGMYISPTSLQDHSKDKLDTERYVNSESVPYIAVASNLIRLYGVKMADIAYVYNIKTDIGLSAIVADAGPRGKYGEGSIYLAKELGIQNTSPRNGGATAGIVTLIFINSHSSWPLSSEIISEIGESLLEQNGGIEAFL